MTSVPGSQRSGSQRPLDANPASIETCEQRLALSASLTGDLLLDLLCVPVASPSEHGISTNQLNVADDGFAADVPSLLDQAAELRATRGLDGSGQTVAVVDSGIAWDHLALGSGFGPGYRVVGGWDFAENDADPYDDGPAGYHGTHVAGLLAGESAGFSGVAPGADIVALRVFDDYGAGTLDWIESSLQWVAENQFSFAFPITTVNLSLGTALSDSTFAAATGMLEDELQLLRDLNIMVFAAAGNQFDAAAPSTELLYPASSPAVIPVTSIEPGGELSDFAQRRTGVVATVGESISSAIPDHVYGWDGTVDDFAVLSGTSMATPQVAGAAMLVRQSMLDAGLEPTVDDVMDRLLEGAVTRTDPITGAEYQTLDLSSVVAADFFADNPLPLDRYDGTADSEIVELDLREGIRLRVGDQTYDLQTDGTAPLVIDAGPGDDSLRIIGSPLAERLIVRPPSEGSSSLSTNRFELELVGFENVSFEGGGGPDRATLFDSRGDDSLTSRPGAATLAGVGFQFDVIDVPRVFVYGTTGGNDVAFLHDSQADDALEVRPQFTSLRNADTFQLAWGFERVFAYATAGGHDTAQLYDSAGNDTMSISPGRSLIAGAEYQVSALGFESTTGHASGGYDVARIYADAGHNQWQLAPDMLQWTGPDGAVRIARGFDRTEAFENQQPIELAPQAFESPWAAWLAEDSQQRGAREAAAARRVFDDLGQERF